MSDGGGYVDVAPRVPASAWVLGWSCLLGQVVLIWDVGFTGADAVPAVLSMIVGGLLVGWFAAGVLRARTVRLVIVWLVMVLGLLALLGSLDGALGLLSLVVGVLQVAALAQFCTSDWFAWHRRQPAPDPAPAIGSLVAIAVAVGVLGGITAPAVDGGLDFQVRVDGPRTS